MKDPKNSWPFDSLNDKVGDDKFLDELHLANKQWANFEFEMKMYGNYIETYLTKIELMKAELELEGIEEVFSSEFNNFYIGLLKLSSELKISCFDGGGKEKFTNQCNSVIQYCNELLKKYFDY